MKLSFTTYQLGRTLPLEKLIEIAREAGCAGIEFRISAKHGHGVEIATSPEERCRIRRAMEDAYLEVASITTGFQFHYPDEGKRRENVEGAKQAAKLAHDLGCRRIRVFGNVIPEGVNAQECVTYVGDALAEVAAFAAPLNVDVLLEMHGMFNFWGYALGAVQRAGKANVGINYNCDSRDLVKGSVRETFERVAPYVRHVHLHELDSVEFPYQEFFRLLVRVKYQGYISAEIADSPDPKRVMSLYAAVWRTMVQLAELSLR